MLKNYLKLAIKVLGRKKFFTFISLFGISFTLMILMLVTSFLETELGDHAPLTEKDKMVFVPRIALKKIVNDTIPAIDSSMVKGLMVYDTTYSYQERNSSMSSSSAGYALLDKHLRQVQGVEKYSFYTSGTSFDIFLNSNKLTFEAIYTDNSFWEIFDFEFIEGENYTETHVENQQQVIVISDKAAKGYFGRTTGVLGEDVFVNDKHYKVLGVVKQVSSREETIAGQLYIPYLEMGQEVFKSQSYLGSFTGVFMGKDKASVPLIIADIQRIADSTDPVARKGNNTNFNKLEIHAYSFFQRYASGVVLEANPKKSVRLFLTIMIGLLTLFVLLPTLNLININISRIMERSAEIGVRKAFGADSGTILFQFVFENIILTFIGGLIGFILALILLNVINSSQILGDTILAFNFKVFFLSMLICLLFGILSGLIPAYKMSKIHIVNALKQNQL